MVEKKLITLSLICVILSVGIVGAVMIVNQKDSELQTKTEQISGLENEKLTLETQVSTMQTDISSLQSEASSLSSEKTALEVQVSSLQTEAGTLENEKNTLEVHVSTLETEKATLETQVRNLQSETTTLNNEVSSLETQVSNLQTDVADLENDVVQSYNVGYDEGESDGHQLGYDEGYLQGVEDLTQTGWYLRDPTYQEAAAFINSDKTDENVYTDDYVCYDFTADFDYNAAKAGYRCGFVYIEYSDSAHAIACFNTTDNSIIYVEPKNDEIVTIAIGQLYLGYIVVDLGIIW
jgi:cell division protein FtsB